MGFSPRILSLPTAYVVRGKVMFWHASVHPSICLSTPRRGGTPARSRQGGTPPWVPPPHQTWWGGGILTGGTPPWVPPVRPGRGGTLMGGYPTLGTPLSDLAGGYPTLGTPCQTWPGVPHLRYPPSDLVGGYPNGGPHLRYPPARPGWGVPRWVGGYPTE